MKNIIYLTVFSLWVLLISSCGEDNIIQVNVPIGTVLFSADSIYIQADSGYAHMVTGSGAYFRENTAAYSVEVQYRIRTNVDRSADSCYIRIHDSTNGMPQSANVLNIYQTADTVYKQIFRITEQPYLYILNADIVVSQRLLTDRFIILTDLRITKTQ